jgi:hypothetical protein
MATTQLADLKIVPSIFHNGLDLMSLSKDELVQSGAVRHEAYLDEFLNGNLGGRKIEIRQNQPLDGFSAENISTDDPSVMAVPDKLSQVATSAIRQSLNKSWSEMDLAADLAGVDPIAGLSTKIAKYWTTRRQYRILSTILGLLADSKANHNGDLFLDVAKGGQITEENLVTPDNIIDTAVKMGDQSTNLTGMYVHSKVMAAMQKQNLIETVRNSQNDIQFRSYLGYPVVVDDSLTVEEVPADGQNDIPAYTRYYSYLFGQAAIVFGSGMPKNPVEVQREMLAGTGGGMSNIASRMEWIIHPQGYRFIPDVTPTQAVLESAGSWERVWDRKRIKLAVLISNA